MPEDTSDVIARVARATMENIPEVERSNTLEIVLNNAADIGAESAIERFGGSLSTTDKAIVRSLSRDEFVALKAIKGKIGGVNPAAHNFII